MTLDYAKLHILAAGKLDTSTTGSEIIPGSAEHVAILASHMTELLCQQGDPDATHEAWTAAKREAQAANIWREVLSIVMAGRTNVTLYA